MGIIEKEKFSLGTKEIINLMKEVTAGGGTSIIGGGDTSSIINYNDFRSFLLIMILGGSLGNVFDRVYFRAVPDFIDIHHGDFHWFVFNVADIFITLGVLSLIMTELFINKNIKNENK